MPLREAGSSVDWDTEHPSPAHLWFPGGISSTISSPRQCGNQQESLNDLFMETSLKLCSGFPSVGETVLSNGKLEKRQEFTFKIRQGKFNIIIVKVESARTFYFPEVV